MEALIASPSETADYSSFGQIHFGQSDLGDKRLTARAVRTGNALLRHPGGTLPSKLPRDELLGFYAFANNAKVDHAKVLAPHLARTRQLMERCVGTVLIIHDTTECDLSGLSIGDLGPIGNGTCRGLLVHNSLAVDLASGEALGLVGQSIHRRREVEAGERLAAKRDHPERESRLWLRGIDAVGSPPSGARWVNLMDRGGDTFESLGKQHALGQFYLVRSKSNRRVEVADGSGRWVKRKLHEWARQLKPLGTRRVKVSAQPGQPAREATVSVACGAARLLAPAQKRGEHGNEALDLWVIRVREVDAPRDVQPLEWILLSNVPTETKSQAWECVGWYERRPIIEEFHKAQKTGCSMEQVQFTTRKAIEVTIAMISVVASQLLRLRDLARRPDADTVPATEAIDEEYVCVLSQWKHKDENRLWSVRDFLYAVARMGGHLNRRGDRLPGWLVLWRGWQDLQRLVEGARLYRRKRST